jgi:hypothetical protein
MQPHDTAHYRPDSSLLFLAEDVDYSFDHHHHHLNRYIKTTVSPNNQAIPVQLSKNGIRRIFFLGITAIVNNDIYNTQRRIDKEHNSKEREIFIRLFNSENNDFLQANTHTTQK